MLALRQYSSVAGRVEREGEVVVKLGDAVYLSYFNYDLARRSIYELLFRVFPNLGLHYHLLTTITCF
jgi:hypothetical protein